MYIGLDIGTSGVKAVLVDDSQAILAEAQDGLTVQRPHALWSEQDPAEWWRAARGALAQLRAARPAEYAAVKAMGLSGQMHGATLLDAKGEVLRPAILWNDGRSGEECAELMASQPDTPAITGNAAMPGFTAPKLLWVAKHEPEIFARTALVLLPKDYVRLKLTGEAISDMSDSAGTLWLDVARRDWSDSMLAACGLSRAHMPALVEGSEAGGRLTDAMAAELGFDGPVLMAGGAGDNAAGAAGIGAVVPGQAFLSLGTSGVYFLSNAEYSPNPEGGVHSFCHCIPDTWHQMSVILSAASCLSWLAKATGAENEAALLAEAEQGRGSAAVFLPYLSGERTPHNDPMASGVFFGLTHETDRAALTHAVLEGVAFALADGQAALLAAGGEIKSVSVIGGGARSKFWGRILASALGRSLNYHPDGEVGPAFGAARLARLALTREAPADICTPPPVDQTIAPDNNLQGELAARYGRYRRLYGLLRDEFRNGAV
ncbi:MAG: xylulokinase [Hyphomicrobiales bacterium]|nr:MAG: xylulokinase [Hyphomicrobiales bacterium]